MDIGESTSVQIKVEIHPRYDEDEGPWVVSGGVEVREGQAHKTFSIAYHFPTKEDAEKYVQDNIVNWSQGIQ